MLYSANSFEFFASRHYIINMEEGNFCAKQVIFFVWRNVTQTNDKQDKYFRNSVSSISLIKGSLLDLVVAV